MTLRFNSAATDVPAEFAPESGQGATIAAQNAVHAGPPAKRGPGAPLNNKNRLVHGRFSKDIGRAKRRRLRGTAKRLELETLAAVLRDQGNPDELSATMHFTIARFAKRVGRLAMIDRAIERLIRHNPLIRQNGRQLAELYEIIRPLETDTLRDAERIGLTRRDIEPQDLNTVLDDLRREQEQSGEGSGE